MNPLSGLLTAQLGARRADELRDGMDLAPSLRADTDGWVPRSVLAQALAVVLFDDLLGRVPSAAAYIEE